MDASLVTVLLFGNGKKFNLDPTPKKKENNNIREKREGSGCKQMVSFFVRGGKYSTINVGLCVDILVSVIIVLRRNMHIAHRWIEQKKAQG